MALVDYEEGKTYAPVIPNNQGNGLYLKSLRGKSRQKAGVFKIEILRKGKKVSYKINYRYDHVILYGQDFEIKCCFVNDDELIFHIEGVGISVIFDSMPESMYDYSFELNNQLGKQYFVINSYKSQTKYFVHSTKSMTLNQKFNDDMQGNTESILQTSEGTCDVVIQEIPTHLCAPDLSEYTYEACEKRAKDKINTFINNFKKKNVDYPEKYNDALYTTWSATVRASGNLTREVTWMSNTNFPGIWSWDHCFNTLATMETDPNLAFNNMMIVYDFQDKEGQIPGSVSDSNIHWNFAKPPIQGFVIGKMLKKMVLTKEQKEELYKKLGVQVHFWLEYKDSNSDGIPEYHHGNDSGYDNSTVFSTSFCVDSPDLTAYIIVALDTLQKLAIELELPDQSIIEKRTALIDNFKKHFIVGSSLVARETMTQKIIPNKSILSYNSLLISKYLPKKLTSKLAADLKEKFNTPYGLATEEVSSELYKSDGYWRGPIWAPEMVILIEAIEQTGDTNFSWKLLKKFIHTIEKSGFSENFDATDGKGLRDTAHTWTSSSYIYLVNKLVSASTF